MSFTHFLLLSATVITFVVFAYCALKMAGSAKDRGHLWRRETGWNPFLSFYRPGLLSPEGLVYRKRAGYAGFLFFILLHLTTTTFMR